MSWPAGARATQLGSALRFYDEIARGGAEFAEVYTSPRSSAAPRESYYGA